MSGPEIAIDTLRREIDRLDDAIHDLLMRRAELAARVGELKRRGGETKVFIRAGREAEILRHLLTRHRGPFSSLALARIWREIIAATLCIEGPLSVAVHAPSRAGGALEPWDLARDYFSSNTPIAAYGSHREVLEAVMADSASVGVLGMPRAREPEPWWPDLVALDDARPRVVACLPFVTRAGAGSAAQAALAIAKAAFEPTGEDVSLLVLETSSEPGRETLLEALAAAGLSAEWISDGPAPAKDDGDLALFKVLGFVDGDDARLDGLARTLRGTISRVVPLGGFAAPIGGNES